ncbi:hypothetical protein P7C70_g764, partial [Phenoliferia sp. Uapishka_3]
MAMCFTSAGLPEPCGGFTAHYFITTPAQQKYFTIGWTCTIALAFLFTVPSIIRYATSPRFLSAGLWSHLGLIEDLTPGGYLKLSSDFSSSVPAPKRPRHILPRSLRALSAAFTSLSLATLPLPSFLDYTRIPFIQRRRAPSCHPTKTYAPFSLGTLLLALLVPLLVLSTLLPESQLRANPNRFGFLALASIPPLFVLSSKNGAISILLGKGWTGANFLHRWLGRIVVLLVLLHFYFWTIQWVASNRVEEFLSQSKERRGIGALVFLLVIAVSSAGPLRRVSYPIFFVLHYVGIIGFLVFVNRHTVYAKGWATWSVVGIYAFDIVGRLLSMRVRYVEVEALDSGMVRIGLTGVHSGWRAGQHLSIRLFFAPPSPSVFSAFRMFEAHPFSISNAPPSVGVLNSGDSASRGIDLFARSCGKGSWTGDLYATAELGARVAEAKANDGNKRVLHMLALVEGPYGGIGPYREVDEENVLLVAGGSGMGFTLGILDELVGRRVNSRTGGKIEVVWAVRERSHITWFASRLRTLINAASSIPGLSMTLRVYVTCDTSLSSAEDSSPSSSAAPSSTPFDLPHTQLLYQRPQLFSIIQDTIGAALAPCGSCYPVCHCGEDNSDGMCANVEEECCGNGPANGRELLSEKSKDTNDDDDEQGDLPKLEKKSCCKPSPPDSDEEDEITVLPPSPLAPTGGASCCKPKAGAGSEVERKPQCGGGCCAGTGAGCCSGGVEGVGEKRETGPLKIRTDGLAVTVCGPGGMIAEMRNAVARVPMAKQARIGGITLHAEHFSV